MINALQVRPSGSLRRRCSVDFWSHSTGSGAGTPESLPPSAHLSE
jgi:hypothetical protein